MCMVQLTYLYYLASSCVRHSLFRQQSNIISLTIHHIMIMWVKHAIWANLEDRDLFHLDYCSNVVQLLTSIQVLPTTCLCYSYTNTWEP